MNLPAPTPAILLKLAHDDTAIMLGVMREQMKAAEDLRSVRRNRNRVGVLACGLVISILWPTITWDVFHSIVGTIWTTAVANTGDMLVTAYAWLRRY